MAKQSSSCSQEYDTDILRKKYNQFLHTEKGKSLLMQSIALKKEFDKESTGVCQNTKDVKTKFLISEFQEKTTKLKINPIGLYLMCHQNAKVFEDEKEGITKTIGFNITSCPCGRYMSYELHSVNKINGELYDFTKDFADETEKYFLDFECDKTPQQFKFLVGDMFHTNEGCKCKVLWKYIPGNVKTTQSKLLKEINSVRDMHIFSM
jgi:hypothetical protein